MSDEQVELAEEISGLIDRKLTRVYTHTLATVTATRIDNGVKIVDVTFKVQRKSGGAYKTIDVIELPMQSLSMGGFTLDLPVKVGDDVVLCHYLFDGDGYLFEGQDDAPPDCLDTHDMNNAIVIPAYGSITNGGNASSADSLTLLHNASRTGLTISPTGQVTLGSNTTDVLGLLSQLMGLLTQPNYIDTDDGNVITAPLIQAPAIAALQIQLDTIKGA